MDPTLRAVLSSWPLGPWTIAALAVTGVIYLRGYRALRRAGSARIGPANLTAFLGGLLAIFVALQSPIEPLAGFLLTMHMVQHLLLILVAAPLIVFGAPEAPLLVGLPRPFRSGIVLPITQTPEIRSLARWLTRPGVALLISSLAVWLWHVPALYDLALRDERWHYVEHASFLLTAILFWWVVIEPFPSRARAARWVLIPYLFLAGIQGGVLAALLTFADRVIYSHYLAVPRLWGISPLAEQSLAGAIMWVAGIVGYLVPAAWIGSRLLHASEPACTTPGLRRGASRRSVTSGIDRTRVVPLPILQRVTPRPFDLLRVPVLGRFLRWRFARPTLQVPLLLLAVAVVWDGLRGPQVAPLNLAGTLPWIHWRGLLVIGLLAAGNLFCTACPFTLPRALARRWLPQGRAWPRRLRTKWLAVALLLAFFIVYEAADLWARPWWTAVVVIVFFAAAFLVDGLFRAGSFCKYVCPIGQFNFVHSLISPLDVRIRSLAVCGHCSTHDCIRGSERAPGCETGLFLPRKGGGMDCTLCLDCVHACPHDNVGIVAAAPGSELWRDRLRSGLGRLTRRTDIAALVLMLVFAAFVNAAGMVAPVLQFEQRITASLGLANRAVVVVGLYVVSLVIAPALLVFLASLASRNGSGDPGGWPRTATRYAYAFVPLGFAMWLAHYGFHLATSAGAAVPAAQRFAADLGLFGPAAADLTCNCCGEPPDWLLRAEIVALDAGLLLSLYAAYRIAGRRFADFGCRARAVAPWAAIMLLLFAIGVWILFQPMQMRGTTGVQA